MRKVLADSIEPGAYSRLTRVDLLTASYKTDDDCPVSMTIHIAD